GGGPPRAIAAASRLRRSRRRDASGDHCLGVLGRTTTRPLERQHLALEEEPPAPDAVRLVPCEGALEARLSQGALGADRLRPGNVVKLLGEEQRGEVAGAVLAPGLRPLRLPVLPPLGEHRS